MYTHYRRRMELIVHENPATASSAVASLICEEIAKHQGRFSFGLAGGSTPTETYQQLRNAQIDWERVDGWLPDERWVPPDSERSNGRMAGEILFDHIAATLHRPPWEPTMDPQTSASVYEKALESILGDGPDLVFLGMGDDGHTASLFPGSPALDETEQLYVANVIPESGEIRLTATYPLLNRARLTVFLVFGDAKASALRDSFEGKTSAGRVGEGNGEVLWHVDRAAASLLS